MKIEIESTDKVVNLAPAVGMPAVPARVWEGKTANGVAVHCFITRISPQSNDETDLAIFERELKETKAPSPGAQIYPLHMVL